MGKYFLPQWRVQSRPYGSRLSRNCSDKPSTGGIVASFQAASTVVTTHKEFLAATITILGATALTVKFAVQIGERQQAEFKIRQSEDARIAAEAKTYASSKILELAFSGEYEKLRDELAEAIAKSRDRAVKD